MRTELGEIRHLGSMDLSLVVLALCALYWTAKDVVLVWGGDDLFK